MVDEERPEDLGDEESLERYRRSRWTGKVDRGGLPRVPVRDSLPEASDLFAYALVTVRGTPDVTYQCLRNASGVWGWRQVVTGGV